MTLLALLNELEPNAGWKQLRATGYGVVAAAVNATMRINQVSSDKPYPWMRVVVFDLDIRSKAWRKCESTAVDLRTALHMALTGYRAGEAS